MDEDDLEDRCEEEHEDGNDRTYLVGHWTEADCRRNTEPVRGVRRMAAALGIENYQKLSENLTRSRLGRGSEKAVQIESSGKPLALPPAQKKERRPISEKSLRTRILAELRAQPSCKVVTMTGVSEAGTPDILGCYRGRMFAVEVKVGHNKVTTLQSRRLFEWADAGAVVDIAMEDFSVAGFLSRLGKKEKVNE